MKQIILIAALFACTATMGQEDSSLLDLMKQKIPKTNKAEQEAKDNPNLITTISGHEIRRSGARDLIDVLRLVPGIYFAYDLDNVVSIGIRGNWAQEGKVLLMIDNQEVNESSYGNLVFNNHYPLENIERIDVVRGPASAQHGGNAGMAVIHIITRRGGEVAGINAAFTSGQFDSANARRSLEIMAGRLTRDSTEWSILGFATTGNMSSQVTESKKHGRISYKDASAFANGFALLKVSTKNGWHLRTLLDAYRTHATLKNEELYFKSSQYSLRKDQKVNSYLTLSPRVILRSQQPWNWAGQNLGWANSRNMRITARLTGSYIRQFKSGNSETYFGAEYFNDRARFTEDVNGQRIPVNLQYYNASLFLHEAWFGKFTTVQGGFRVEKHTLYGPVFVPRMSVSQKIKKHWNTKLIYSRAFRAPALLTLYYGGAVPLKPEKIRNLEAELAYEPRRGCFAKLAVYQVHIKDPIVYSTNGFTDVDEFTNKTRTGSYGAEIEGRYVAENWFFYGSYTYAHQYRNEVQNFKVRADSLTTMLAFPLHKLAANFNYIINKQFILNCGLLAESRRFGYDEDSALRYFAPVVLVNASLTYRHPGKLFEAQVAVMDLLNQQYTFPQAYRSAYGSLPGPGRELLIRLKINLHERPEN